MIPYQDSHNYLSRINRLNYSVGDPNGWCLPKHRRAAQTCNRMYFYKKRFYITTMRCHLLVERRRNMSNSEYRYIFQSTIMACIQANNCNFISRSWTTGFYKFSFPLLPLQGDTRSIVNRRV